MAYTSFKTRKALGRRYGTDPALLLEMERLNQQYQLAPGREARGMQAAQIEYQKGQDILNRREREEANRQAAKSGMVGTASNLATTGLTLRALTKGKDAKFFGDWGGTPKTVPGANTPTGANVSISSPQAVQGAQYGNLGGEGFVPNTVTPATTDMAATGIAPAAGTGLGAETGGIAGAYAAEDAAAGAAMEAGGTTAGGIVGGVTTAAPYYAAARIGGKILTSIHDKPMSTTTGQGYMHALGKSLESPLNVERTWGQALGLEDDDSTTINLIHDIINPLGYVERQAGTVICTELHRQGIMGDEMFEADKAFGRKQDIETIAGYHTWAIPLANLMRKSAVVTRIITPIAMAWAEDMAGGKNMFGRFLSKIGIPICRFIGSRAMEVAHG